MSTGSYLLYILGIVLTALLQMFQILFLYVRTVLLVFIRK